MIHFILVSHGVHLDLVSHLIFLALDVMLVGIVAVRIWDILGQPKRAEIADERRERWFAHHPEAES